MTDATTTIDETPISPTRSLERRDSLEKHLQHRPDVQDLKNRHILLDTNTAPYVSSILNTILPLIIYPSIHPYTSNPPSKHLPESQSKPTNPHPAPSKPKPSSSNASVQQTT